MELERPKKNKHRKKAREARELSPPPLVLTVDELEEQFVDAYERQPSTSGIQNEDTTKEIVNNDSKTASGEGDATKSDGKIGDIISTNESSSIDSKEINEIDKFVFQRYILLLLSASLHSISS